MRLFLAFLFAIIPTTTLADVTCSTLDSEECINSTQCILDQKDKEYFCRTRKAPCEVDLPNHRQEKRKVCEERGGCALIGNCYCACNDKKHPKFNTCDCYCGGGLPADCREEK